MSEPIKPPSELETRALRDIIFGPGNDDENWDRCKSHWMEPEETKWLQAEYAKLKAKETNGHASM
jgi:hypothetical protein